MPAVNRFPEETWKEIVAITASAFVMDSNRAGRLQANATARLIAAIPFLAGCREPKRTALAHLATFIVAGSDAGEAAFDHKAEDNYDTMARLATIAHFEGGDPATIDKGMKLLAAMMIEGYKKDVASDKAKGLYNPVGAGAWDPDRKLASLSEAANAVRDAEMDAIAADSKASWWSKP